MVLQRSTMPITGGFVPLPAWSVVVGAKEAWVSNGRVHGCGLPQQRPRRAPEVCGVCGTPGVCKPSLGLTDRPLFLGGQ